MPSVEMSERFRLYCELLEARLEQLYDISRRAKLKGLDPSTEPESRVAKDLGAMVEGLVGPPGVAERIRQLSSEVDRYQLAFTVAGDITHAKFGPLDDRKASEQAVKTSLAILTGGITAAPIQGISEVKIKENADRSRYLAIYFAGPMRSAGGTEQALTLVLGDYVRRHLGLDRYKPTNDEVQRFAEELRVYEREVGRFQYHIPDAMIENAIRSLPVEPNGTETDRVEVTSFRNLPRIETNRVRGGALRVVNDGICGRALKVLKIVESLGLEGWKWLEHVETNNTEAGGETESEPGSEEEDTTYYESELGPSDEMAEDFTGFTFMEDVIAGRPIFSFPSRSGGFRLRYGRSRNTGLASLGVHPATMAILGNFLAVGTQMRVEKPGKGGVAMPVDSIESPIVKLKNGSIVRVRSAQEANRLSHQVDKILFLGDLLVAYGEFLENNKLLYPCGYNEEWWAEEAKFTIAKEYNGSADEASKKSKVDRLRELIAKPLELTPTALETIRISRSIGIPIHPSFTFFWEDISIDELLTLRSALLENYTTATGNGHLSLIIREDIKLILDKLCMPHRIEDGRIYFDEEAVILESCLRLEDREWGINRASSAIEAIEELSELKVRVKGGTYVGARMGRPEKARERKMSPPVHALFPVGLSGGAQRNIVEAVRKGNIDLEIAKRRCPQCKTPSFKARCKLCGTPTFPERICPTCKRTSQAPRCPECDRETVGFDIQSVNIRELFTDVVSKLGVRSPELVKGVRGLTNADKTPEPIEKGVLRAEHDLYVFKDGTIRFDATNAPLTHFKPREIGVTVERLRELGYLHDIYGNRIVEDDQICELLTQDVVVPEPCADYLVRVSCFIDDLLVKVYGQPPYYNAKTRDDLIGHLIVGLAPHTSAGVLGRVAGFTKARACYSHPLWHNVKRRDCDGDEDSIMLALDILLNFSKAYLPTQIGGMMDAPLLIISTINPFEVDESQNLDVARAYPLVFYESVLKLSDPARLRQIIDTVSSRLGTPAQFEGYSFTHPTSDINGENWESSYLTLGSMTNKLESQLNLAEKIRAVDAREVARRILTTHFIRDIVGNLKAFSGQKFRCKKCNTKYRRIPLIGKCLRCGGDLLMTVYKGGIEKYLDAADGVTRKYGLSPYYHQRIDLVRDEIESLFKEETKEKAKQVRLGQYM